MLQSKTKTTFSAIPLDSRKSTQDNSMFCVINYPRNLYTSSPHLLLYEIFGFIGNGYLGREDEGFPPVHHFAVSFLRVL